MVTESFVKVTNELVVERKARNSLEGQLKLEQNRREETGQRAHKLATELATEKEQRERPALEVHRLRKDLAFERSLRETAEEKAQMLEGSRETTSSMLQMSQGSNPDAETDLLRKLELELSIERGLREKTEKLLQTAENRIHDLHRELQYLQQRTQQSPFGNWLGSQQTATNERTSEDKKIAEVPPSLSGISLSGFDPEAFGFKGSETAEARR